MDEQFLGAASLAAALSLLGFDEFSRRVVQAEAATVTVPLPSSVFLYPMKISVLDFAVRGSWFGPC